MSNAPTVSVREWTDLVRRARLGKTTKYVALMLATYADYADGTRIFPGVVRLAWAAEVDVKTAKKGVAELLRVGLIEVVRGAGVRDRGVEYRLTIGANLLEEVAVPGPAEAAVEIERLAASRRRSARTAHRVGRPEPVDNAEDGPRHGPSSTDQVEEGRPTGGSVRDEGRPTPFRKDGPPGSAIPPTDLDTLNIHSGEDLRTAVTPTRATGPDQDPIPPPLPDRCAHGLTSRRRADGQPSCALCRRETTTAPDNVVHLRPRTA